MAARPAGMESFVDPAESYQLDSDEFEQADSENGSLDDQEYDALLDEGEKVDSYRDQSLKHGQWQKVFLRKRLN